MSYKDCGQTYHFLTGENKLIEKVYPPQVINDEILPLFNKCSGYRKELTDEDFLENSNLETIKQFLDEPAIFLSLPESNKNFYIENVTGAAVNGLEDHEKKLIQALQGCEKFQDIQYFSDSIPALNKNLEFVREKKEVVVDLKEELENLSKSGS